MPKVYSPSSTITFQRCPRLWQLKKDGLVTVRIGSNEIAAAAGHGFGAGMEAYFKAGGDTDIAVETAVDAAMSQIERRQEQGGVLDDRAAAGFELLSQRVEKAVRGFDKQQPLPGDWHTFLTELPLPDQGYARPDLVCQTASGPTVLDFKTKVTAKDWIIDAFIEDFEYSWQMYHYVWALRENNIPVDNIALCLAVLSPLCFYVHQFAVDEEYLGAWEADARNWWSQMEEVEGGIQPALRVGNHRDQYGQCALYEYCVLNQRRGFIKEPSY